MKPPPPGDPISRRAFIRRVGAAGIGLGFLGILTSWCMDDSKPDPPARLSGPLAPSVSNWILSAFPIMEITREWDSTVVLHEWGFDLEQLIAEGVRERTYWASYMGTLFDTPDSDSRWERDLYLGMVPFVDLATFAEAGLAEPWDPYLGDGVTDTWIPSVRDEATYGGQIYSYPFQTNIVATAWHAGIVEAAGLDPEHLPSTWDEWIRSARLVMDSGAAPFGAGFNPHGWLSLVPIAHSIDSDVYTEDGLFDFTHEAVVEALEIMMRLKEVSSPDVLEVAPMRPLTSLDVVDGVGRVDAFAAERAAYYFDHLYALVNRSSGWSDPSHLRIGTLPSIPGGAGGTVFWSVGTALFALGTNKERAVEYLRFLTQNEGLYGSTTARGKMGTGLLHPVESVWEKWKAVPPPWLGSWAVTLKNQLRRSRSIPTFKGSVFDRYPYYRSGAAQFHIGRPHWETYLRGEERDPRRALEKAKQAVLAES